jgi:Fe-S cluster assembly protein SufD
MNALAQQWSEAFRSGGRPAGPAWLDELRTRAADQLHEHGLPNRTVEAWKYTPMRALEALHPLIRRFEDTVADADVAARPSDLLENPDYIIDVCDGKLAGHKGNGRPGVTVVPLAQGLEAYEARLRKHVEAVDISGSTRAFAALNTAFLEHGVVIHIDSQADAGTVLLRWAFSGKVEASMHNFRVFLLLEPGAQLQFTEQFEGASPSGHALNVISHTELGKDAVLDHVRVQRESENTVLISSTRVTLAEGSRYSCAGFDLGGGLVRHELHAELAGAGAHAAFMGAFVLDNQRHVDNHISVDHAAPDCSSEQFFRGVLGGRSRGVFNGRALIRPGADGSSVRQSNANLLLSGLAEMDTKPELEIYADEVEASHGATVGQLDETAVFYLRSRGLSDSAARRMLTGAFCRAVTDRLENSVLAGRIAELIDEVMPSDRNEEGRSLS